jgi:hypothetical protein
VELTQISARFFLELALGLFAGLLLIQRRTIGAGFTRLTVAFTLASLVPGLLLVRSSGAPAPGPIATIAFGVAALVVLVVAGRLPRALESALVVATAALGTAALLMAGHAQAPQATTANLALAGASMVASTLVLGLVTGAMILGHWYLVTPDLPVSHLGRFTVAALVAVYVKFALLVVTAVCFRDRFGDAARSFAAVVGVGGAPTGSFQSQLDFLWLVARVFIGVVGPAVLLHMTLATIRLKATQPATGILYAATVMVLMGELFAFVAERSFAVVL